MALGPKGVFQQMGAGAGTLDAATDEGLRAYMLKVYNYMGSGLALSGIVALLAYESGLFYSLAESGFYTLIMWTPLVLLLIMTFGVAKLSPFALQGLFWAFCAVDGLSLSYIFEIYASESIVRVLFITAATFGAMSLLGYTTKKSLVGMGSFLYMGLIGVFLASLVNIFLQSSGLAWMISVIGVLVMVGLTAYVTQQIKAEFIQFRMTGGVATKTAVMGAVMLYILFISVFQFLLMFMGNRN